MNAVIICIGTELTTGQSLDTNSAWLSAELTAMAVTVVRHVTVDDHLPRIQRAIQEALRDAAWVIVTGGLGPTPDDLTREALSAATGLPLEENPEALGQIRGFFERWQRPMPEANRRQAQIPRGCSVILNSWGTAPGIWHRGETAQLVALPGVPGEMMNIFQASVAPELLRLSGGNRCAQVRLRCFGMSEATIGERLADLMARDRNPLIGTLAARGVITVSIVARGGSEAEAASSAAAEAAEVRRRLGSVVFGENDDTLESVVGPMLRRRQATLAVAESCTGGLLAKRITDVPGSSDYFLRGYVSYANSAKIELLNVPTDTIDTFGAVSEEVALAMAAGCLAAARSDHALAITGIAGPGGGHPPDKPLGLAFIGLADAAGTQVKRVLLGSHLSRAEIRDRAASASLNLLRLRLAAGRRRMTPPSRE